MSEAAKIEAWIETCSQDMNSNKTHGCDKDGYLFDILDNNLCALIAEAHRQACHARLLEGARMEWKEANIKLNGGDNTELCSRPERSASANG